MKLLTFGWCVAFVGLGLGATIVGCGDDDSGDGDGSGGSSSSSGTCAPATGCPEVASECLALTDNSGLDTFALRMGQLTVTKPDIFSDGLVRNIVADGVTLNLGECQTDSGSPLLTGMGSFSWILEFDKATNMLKTGGAKPASDPYGGYCFVNENIQGFDVAPIELSATIEGGTVTIPDTIDVTVPIYTDDTASEVILLPLQGVRLLNMQLSDDQNCIGDLNDENLDPVNLCLPEPSSSIWTFNDAGTIEGFVTLEDADGVTVDALGDSLCVLLAGSDFDDGGSPGKCTRDAMGNFEYQGDWCSTTNAAATAGCADAIQLRADFSASAVQSNGDCN